MRKVVFTILIGVLFGVFGSAHAAILNLGAEIATDGTITVVPFFDGKPSGLILGPGSNILIVLDAASTFGPAGNIINSAELFVDATQLEGSDSSLVIVQSAILGPLQDINSGVVKPLIGGGTTPVTDGSTDNSFYTLSGVPKTSLPTDSLYTLNIANIGTSGEFRVDGINIQADVSECGQPVPEPATIFLLGAGLLGLAGFRKKRS